MNIRELGQFTYEVQSEHRQMEWYRVDLCCDDHAGLPACDCPNFRCVKNLARQQKEANPYLSEGSCKHIVACLARLNQDMFSQIYHDRNTAKKEVSQARFQAAGQG